MPDAAKPKKGSKRDPSAPSAGDPSQGTEGQTDVSTDTTIPASPGETDAQEPAASTQEADNHAPSLESPQEAPQETEVDSPAAEASAATGQQELTREQLERLRNRLKARFHS